MFSYLWTRIKGVGAVAGTIIGLLGVVVLLQRSKNKEADEQTEQQRARFIEANNAHTKDTIKIADTHRKKAKKANKDAADIKAVALKKIIEVKQNENAKAILDSLNS